MSIFFKNKPEDFKGSLQVVTCFMEFEGSLLLLKRSSHCLAPHQWAIPGGKVEREETLNEALERELNEELMICIDWELTQLINYFYVRHSLTDYKLYLYQWRMCSLPHIQLNPNEHEDVMWCPKDQIHEVDLIEGQLEAFKFVYKD